MKAWRIMGTVVTAVALSACGSSPKPNYYTLLDGVRTADPAKRALSVAVMPASIPDLHDRPQMVVRLPGGRVQMLEQQRWAEPLRYEVPRLVAAELGQKIDSSAVVALPEDVQSLNPEYRLWLDVQRIDVESGGSVGIDVAWRLVGRDGKARHGRSVAVESAAAQGDTPAQIAAYRRGFARVASDVATVLLDNARPAASR